MVRFAGPWLFGTSCPRSNLTSPSLPVELLVVHRALLRACMQCCLNPSPCFCPQMPCWELLVTAIVHLFGNHLHSHCLRSAGPLLCPVPSSLGIAGVHICFFSFSWFLLMGSWGQGSCFGGSWRPISHRNWWAWGECFRVVRAHAT